MTTDRKKIFLALLEAFGTKLDRTDFQKLLFLFCQRTGRSYYDFFPYKYGSFSIMTYVDKKQLTEKGVLKKSDNFELEIKPELLQGSSTYYQSLLTTKEREHLKDLLDEVGNMRGRELLHKMYLEFPLYTVRSEILSTTLTATEQEQIKKVWSNDISPLLFTIGYESLSIDEYLNVLVNFNISALVDVRRNPISRKIGFSKKLLEKYLRMVDIQYYHLPELGIASYLRQNLTTPEAYQNLFKLYEEELLPKQTEALDLLEKIIKNRQRVALTCFEADAVCCHRHRITSYLQLQRGLELPVEHLLVNKSSEISNGHKELKHKFIQKEMDFVFAD